MFNPKLLRVQRAKGAILRGRSSDVAELERLIGASLPDDFAKFVSVYGGATLDAEFDLLEKCSSGNTQGIEVFYGLSHDKEDDRDLRDAYTTYADRLPNAVIPVGHDAMGNEIVLSCRRKDYGTVYFYDRSNEAAPGVKQVTERSLYQCAKTFKEFLDKLRPAEDLTNENEEAVRSSESPEAAEIRKRLLSGKVPDKDLQGLMTRLTELAKASRRMKVEKPVKPSESAEHAKIKKRLLSGPLPAVERKALTSRLTELVKEIRAKKK